MPVVGIGKRYGLSPDFITLADVQPLQIAAVRDMYLRHPDAKWHYVVGDDTFVLADSVVRMLENYDADQPLWLTPGAGLIDAPAGFDASAWPLRDKVIDERSIGLEFLFLYFVFVFFWGLGFV